MQSYYANGKFLLTGEYYVLKGALALALPLQKGQSLTVEWFDDGLNQIKWVALTPDGLWFNATLNKHNLEIISCSDTQKTEKLAQIISELKKLNNSIFDTFSSYHFHTTLDFNPNWGLGSSSTLIANLADFAHVDAYALLENTFGGSGYDLACAHARQAVLYQRVNGKPQSKEIDFLPDFAQNLYFIYQGKKQNSSKEVKQFLNSQTLAHQQNEIDLISEITRKIVQTTSLTDFCLLLEQHEKIITQHIHRERLQKQFPDFEGCIKSLGAWGGDFFMAATTWSAESTREYFKSKGLNTFFTYNNIVINGK